MASAAVKLERPVSRYRERPRNHPTTQCVVRVPKELIEAGEKLGRTTRTDFLIQLLDEAVDARGVLGALWAQVQVRAAEDQVTDGEALGRIAREALEGKGKGRQR